jgi:uncharacterized protein
MVSIRAPSTDRRMRESWGFPVIWFNEPAKWSEGDGEIDVRADAHTDFWCTTGYGYDRDNGHIYGDHIDGDFDLKVRIEAEYADQYDQAGVAVRVDERHWIKTGVEQFDGRLRFGTVVTAENSNWMIADLPEVFEVLNLSLARRGDAINISYSVDENTLEFAAVVYVRPEARVLVGVMCAAPEGGGFNARFRDLHLSPV